MFKSWDFQDRKKGFLPKNFICFYSQKFPNPTDESQVVKTRLTGGLDNPQSLQTFAAGGELWYWNV